MLSKNFKLLTKNILTRGKLCFLAREGVGGSICGAIVCKLDAHKKVVRRGYIAMLAVDKQLRKQGIGKELVRSYSLNTIRDTLI